MSGKGKQKPKSKEQDPTPIAESPANVTQRLSRETLSMLGVVPEQIEDSTPKKKSNLKKSATKQNQSQKVTSPRGDAANQKKVSTR